MQNKVQVLKIVTVSVLVLIVLLFAALIIDLVKLSKAGSRERALEAELSRLNQTYSDGEDEISLKQNRDYIMRYGREYLDMVGEDEQVFTGE